MAQEELDAPTIKQLIKALEAIGNQGEYFNRALVNWRKKLVEVERKAYKPPPTLVPQPARGGYQLVTGGHIFPKDKYRPHKIEIFENRKSKRHLGPTCMICGAHACINCVPSFLTQKCPGPKDVWPRGDQNW